MFKARFVSKFSIFKIIKMIHIFFSIKYRLYLCNAVLLGKVKSDLNLQF